MKAVIRNSVLGVLCLSMMGAGVAVGGTFGDFTYTVLGDNTIEITGYTGAGGIVLIPESINSTNVSSLGENVFNSLGSLTDVIISDSITNIADSAFYYCHSLTNIQSSSENPCYLSSGGVLYNKGMTEIIKCGGGVSGSFVIPSSVTTVGFRAFFCCGLLTNVILPNQLLRIDDGGFDSCDGLSRMEIPASVTNIRRYAFIGCNGLEAVYFAGDAPLMGEGVFDGPPPPADVNPTIYYHSDASGFGTTFAEMSTALIPEFTTMSTTATNMVMNALGTDGQAYVLQSSTNLTQGAWTSLETNAVSGGGVEFNLPTQGAGKFYRVVIEL